jgi:hypothetical protein
MVGSIKQKDLGPSQLGKKKKQDPIFKITRAKGAGGMPQAIECLSS